VGARSSERRFRRLLPWLERTIELSRQRAEHLGYQENMYDALLDLFEPGIKSSRVTRIFDDLKQELVPLVAAIAERSDRVDDAAVHQPFDERAQEAFGKKIAAILGYDFSRGGSIQRSIPLKPPFRATMSASPPATKATSSVPLFGTMHETGHAMYEQGVSPALDHTPLGRGASSAVHESQSRMWENVVGRSRPFWQRYYPDLQRVFPQQLATVDVDTFYGAINTVQPS
jgi:carboxypeptidase Taq